MKSKYQGLLSLIINLSSIFSIIGFGIYLFAFNNKIIEIAPIKPFKIVNVPDKATIKEIEKLNEVIDRIILAKIPTDESVNLELFGIHAPVNKDNKTIKKNTTKETEDKILKYKLSFVLISNDKSLCMINKKMYKKGDILPDGEEIILIKSRQVLIQKNDYKAWIELMNGKNLRDY